MRTIKRMTTSDQSAEERRRFRELCDAPPPRKLDYPCFQQPEEKGGAKEGEKEEEEEEEEEESATQMADYDPTAWPEI